MSRFLDSNSLHTNYPKRKTKEKKKNKKQAQKKFPPQKNKQQLQVTNTVLSLRLVYLSANQSFANRDFPKRQLAILTERKKKSWINMCSILLSGTYYLQQRRQFNHVPLDEVSHKQVKLIV